MQKNKLILSFFGVCCLTSLRIFSDSAVDSSEETIPPAEVITRADAIPERRLEAKSNCYVEAYLQALLDMHYYESGMHVTVSNQDKKIILRNPPQNELISKSIERFIKDAPGLQDYEIIKKYVPAQQKGDTSSDAVQSRVEGIWFPQNTVIFPPLLADSREPVYSVNYRLGDSIMGKYAAAVDMGDDFPIFRWRNVLPWKGDLQIGIQGAIWAVFNHHDVPDAKINVAELMNTDYYLGIPLTYAFHRWAFRFRLYHISSHLGDELLVNHTEWIPRRVNPSFEAIDFISSYQFSSGFRVYGGPGFVLQSDRSFKLKPLYAMWGTELRMFGRKLHYHHLYGTPFFAAHVDAWQERDWDLNATFKLGYELSKLQGVGRKMRVYLEYHQGYSYEGQFSKQKIRYGHIGTSWGF